MICLSQTSKSNKASNTLDANQNAQVMKCFFLPHKGSLKLTISTQLKDMA
jgi:hypothetical protein